MLTKAVVGKPQEPNYNFKIDSSYDINNGYDSSVDYKNLKTISPQMSKLIWEHTDKDVLWDMRYFAHNLQKGWELKYNLIDKSEYQAPEPGLDINVEYFAPVATADDRLRYICENIVTNNNIGLIDQIGNGLASHFYGAQNVHYSMTGEVDPKKALIDYTLLAKEQLDFKSTGKIGNYTNHVRTFFESQKKAGMRFWGTTELHTSIQTAGRRWVNEWYLNDRMNANKGTTANVAEWIASWKNSGLLDRLIEKSGIKSMYDILTSEPGIGGYYGFHGASDLALCPELNAYVDERFVIPGPAAIAMIKKLYPNLSQKEVSYSDRIIWMRENQQELLGLPPLNPFFHNLTTKNGVDIFPHKIDDIKTVSMEVMHCQCFIFLSIRNDQKAISKRQVAKVSVPTFTLDNYM